MGRVAVFIDAGYFWVQATHAILGARGPRTSLTIDYAALHKRVLDEVAAQFPGKDLLRVFWYDGPDTSGAKGPDHLAIDLLDDFKLRLGTRNGVGQQKAVDGMIISDLLTFAQSRSIENALLITGDADLTPGVVSAQALGLRVHLVIIGPQTSTSPYLAAEADRKVIWEPSVVASFAKPTVVAPPPATPATAAPTGTGAPAIAKPIPIAAAGTQPALAQAAPMATQPPSHGAQASAAPPPLGTMPTPATKQIATPQTAGAAPVQPGAPAVGIVPAPTLAPLVVGDFATIAADTRIKLLAGQHAGLIASAPAGAQPLPSIVDKALLRGGMAYAGRMLSEPEKRQLRIAFKAIL